MLTLNDVELLTLVVSLQVTETAFQTFPLNVETCALDSPGGAGGNGWGQECLGLTAVGAAAPTPETWT